MWMLKTLFKLQPLRGRISCCVAAGSLQEMHQLLLSISSLVPLVSANPLSGKGLLDSHAHHSAIPSHHSASSLAQISTLALCLTAALFCGIGQAV